MYKLKRVIPQFDIKLPNCMYTMKNISLASNAASATTENLEYKQNVASNGVPSTAANNFDVLSNSVTATSSLSASVPKDNCKLDLDILGTQIQQILQDACDLNVVTWRQDKVLQQLEELKQQMASIRISLGVCQKGADNVTLPKAVQKTDLKEEPLHDIVINGHPKFIPYALLALKNAWKDIFNINVKAFTHSTLADIGAEALAFQQKLTTSSTNSKLPKINITLIWKNCEHTEMISSPTMYVPIYGEVNIIRYLGRVGPAEYRYENSLQCNKIDSILDLCYQLLRCNSQSSKTLLLRQLGERLGKQKYFAGDEISIADIGVHSSMKRLIDLRDKELSSALKAWRERAHKVTLI